MASWLRGRYPSSHRLPRRRSSTATTPVDNSDKWKRKYAPIGIPAVVVFVINAIIVNNERARDFIEGYIPSYGKFRLAHYSDYIIPQKSL